MLLKTEIKPLQATASNTFIHIVKQTGQRLSETCQKCGKPASKYFTVYNPYNYSYFDVKVCGQCYSDYTPAVKKSGEVVWKRTKPVKTYILFTIIGSRGAAEKLSGLLDRFADSWFARLYARLSAYVVIALGLIAVATVITSTRWYMLNQGTEAFEKIRGIYSNNPLAGTGLLGVDPMLPLLEVAVPFVLALSLHELGHAFVLRFYGYDIRRVGLLLLGPFPAGAFVEPSGSVEGKMSWRQSLQLAGSRVLMNVLLGLAGLAALHVVMAGVVPLTPEAAKHLSVYRDNFNLQLVPPLLLSALGINTPMYAPAGWYTHVLLGDAYVVPLRLAGYTASLNLLVALFNSLPVRILDGGLAFQSLLKSKMGDRGALIAVKYATVIIASMIGYMALIVRV
jgi:Zn-dependent protease